ncbi:unnamed protein product [Spirodela intermedia]|uniref:PRONE domain-containing protein n=1 Tax=Spirodela intermedia TaxID=51605 RepID=A0A7I8JRS3_SPIIN|nr:unnamed protein product [Spirodela intermedia]CAA6672886.1 unnamed protein product [Spirodela intermedia]
MVRFLKRGHSLDRLLHDRGMFDGAAHHAHSLIVDGGSGGATSPEPETKILFRSEGSRRQPAPSRRAVHVEMMKERFSKLLLGEDMSGGGKGVSSALALSNAITNLAASVFGEQWRLEPMSRERKARWRKEIEWLLSVTDHIVEFVPSQQKSSDGTIMEMVVVLMHADHGDPAEDDLHMNILALRKLDAMLVDLLDNFKDQNEFYYASKDDPDAQPGGGGVGPPKRNDDKWWLPAAKKDSVHQILKAAMAINSQVLSEMAIPDAYIDSLPKNGRASLGDAIYRAITDDAFDPEQLLSTQDLSTDHRVLDLKNRIEASVIIWRRKMNSKEGKPSSWSIAVSMEKRELFEERAETLLLLLKQRFPGIPQDVGQSVLESYSRILESLAFMVMSRIEDVLYADSLAGAAPPAEGGGEAVKFPTAEEEAERVNAMEAPSSMTLSDFMGLDLGHDGDRKKKTEDADGVNAAAAKIATPQALKSFSYTESLLGLRSPTARH